MKRIIISDSTMRTAGEELQLSFREKLELCKLLCRLEVDFIETGEIVNPKIDGLLIKSLATAVSSAKLAVPIPTAEDGGAQFVISCLSEAKSPRLQVALPVSTVQMEYLFHKKPAAMLELIAKRTAECRALCPDVEFRAGDAGRADRAFLSEAVKRAVESGASTVTVCDDAGNMLPNEIYDFVLSVKSELPEGVKLGVQVSDAMYMAESCAVEAIKAGADEIKVISCRTGAASLMKLASIIAARGESLGACCGIRVTELYRTSAQIERLCSGEKSRSTPFESGVREDEDFVLGVHDEKDAVRAAAEKLGYDLSEDDVAKVYDAFRAVADKKEKVTAKELDVLIAGTAMQVPPTYKLESYLINAGNVITASSHVRLTKDGVTSDGICVGDGPIDASFLAIEQITGTHYELDDFQIRAVTEGREAMGETVVRLRSDGKLYSGRGISTDVVGSSILAYINALNKIVYEDIEK